MDSTLHPELSPEEPGLQHMAVRAAGIERGLRVTEPRCCVWERTRVSICAQDEVDRARGPCLPGRAACEHYCFFGPSTDTLKLPVHRGGRRMVTPDQKKGRAIFAKILLAMILVALVPLGANWFVARDKSIGDWTRLGEQGLVLAADAIAARVDGWLDSNLRAMRYTAVLAASVSMQAGRQNPILTRMKAAFPWSYLAFTTDRDGRNVGRSDGKKPKDYSDRVYYQRVIRDGADVGQRTLIGRTSGKPAVVLSVPIQVGSERRGVLALASNLTEITESVARSRVGRTGFAFLLDSAGKAVAHFQEELSSTLQDMQSHAA